MLIFKLFTNILPIRQRNIDLIFKMTKSFVVVPALHINYMKFYSKYTQHNGVKGFRGRKLENFTETDHDHNDGHQEDAQFTNEFKIEDREYESIAKSTMQVTRDIVCMQNVLVIQPYLKWGPKKTDVNPELQLQEAEALIRSLPEWNIHVSLKVPLESLEKRTFFGSGKLEELKKLVSKSSSNGKMINCIFISKGTLSFGQKRFLENEFGVPIMDRYSIVIQILRLHATSAESKLQVAMAELPYIWSQMKESNVSMARKQGYFLSDMQKEMLKKREKNLKHELEKIRSQRKLLRNKRKQANFPIIAVIGYTNSGKTSLIKALTDEQQMQPRDQLFATLDVTAHGGILPCNLKVLFMDTVGFMSDIPTELIECFVATLEDAMMAEVIIHVQDLAHPNYLKQKLHVENTLKTLLTKTSYYDTEMNKPPPKIINVGNKIDLVPDMSSLNLDDQMNLISSKTLVGINNLLHDIELEILKATDRKKMTFRVRSGGPETAWLYKNSAVTNSRADPQNDDSILLDVVITNSKIRQFKHYLNKN